MDSITQPPPSILRLYDVTMNNLVPIEDIFDQQVLEGLDTNHQPLELKETIPTIFTSLEEWKQDSTLRCWSCCLTFNEIPCFVPTSIHRNDDYKIEISVEGNFCSFPCVVRYLHENYPSNLTSKHWSLRNNLNLLYYYFTNKHITIIPPAPSRVELQEYGGQLTIEEFKTRIKELKIN